MLAGEPELALIRYLCYAVSVIAYMLGRVADHDLAACYYFHILY